ncbi:ABC transporter ATP-binding protein/permease, partial [Ochrobactrum sp. SFR4]|nr:ABC transporter ATP-binding protein/permease [Ochrobactrum sp. SFR4]
GMRALADANAQASAEMLEYTQGLAVLRAAGCAGEKSVRLQHSIEHLEKIQAIGQRKGAKPNLMIASVMELGLLLVVLIGAVLVFQGSLEVAVLAAVVVIIVRFSEPLSSVILMTLI